MRDRLLYLSPARSKGRLAALAAACIALAIVAVLAMAPAAGAQGEGRGLDPQDAERLAEDSTGSEQEDDGGASPSGEEGGSGEGSGSGEESGADEGGGEGSGLDMDSMEPGTRDALEDASRGDPAAQDSLGGEEEERPATDPQGERLPDEAQDPVEEMSRGDAPSQGSGAEDRSQPNSDSGEEESGSSDEEGGDSERGCSLSPNSSYAFQILSPKDVDHDRSYMVCGVGNYYLTYVDFSNMLQRANPVPDLQDTTYNGFNGLASLAFELNAQMMAMTIDLLNFALDLNLVETLKSSIDRVVAALGEGFYAVLYTAASVVALVYVMYLFAKGRAQDAGFALIKASFVAFIGLWLTGGQAVAVADSVNGYQESLTNAAFSALTGINEDDQSSEALGCDSAEQCISANIWDRYVYDPWANLQISENDETAENERDRILKISNPDDREQELKDLGNEEDEVKSVVDMVYATGHFLKAALQLVVSFFFSILVFTLVFCLIAAEIMMVFFIMTAPIWMVFAIFPAGMLFERFVFYTLAEAAQVFGYKILIAMHLLFMNAIMTNFGTATGYLLACVLTVAAFIKRKTLYKLLAPTGLARSLEARYKRGRQIRADAATARGGGMLGGGGAGRGGSASAAGTAATGVPAAGARPVRQSFTEAKAQMEANSFSPEGLRSGAAVVGAAGAGAAYRSAKAAPGAVSEGSDARAEEAMRLHELAQKRADDPESLSDAERQELEQVEAMSGAGNDPLARASIANRGFVKDAKERRGHRKERNGLSTNAALAGPRRDGESERSYLARQKEARRQANEQRRNLSDMAKNRQGFNMGGYPKTVSCTSCGKPFMASSAADTVCSVCQRHGSNHGLKTNKCAKCGTMLADPNQTLCSRCKDPDDDPNGPRRRGPGGSRTGTFYTGPGSGQRPPRFTTSPDGTVSDSKGGSRSSSDTAASESYEDGSSSETVGRPRATDAGAYDGGYADNSHAGTSYDDGGYEGSGATDGASDDGVTANDRFVGFGHTDPSHGTPVDGDDASATAEGEYADGNDRGVSGPDGFYGSDESGSYEDSGVRRPRGFDAASPAETTTAEPIGEREPAGQPGDTNSRVSPESGDSASEGSASEGSASEGERPVGDGGAAPERPSRAQKFSTFGHTALDVGGYIPAAGAAPDLINAGWYAAEGNRRDAAISAGAAVPVVGDSGKAIADAGKTAKAAKIHARADRIERGIDQARQTSTAGAGKSGSEGGLPNSVRPQRFSQDRDSGLWLPRGSKAVGFANQSGAAEKSAGGGEPEPANSGQNFAKGASAEASAETSAGGDAQSGTGAARAQRPPSQRSEATSSGRSRESSGGENSARGTPSKESPSKESSAREGSSKESSPKKEPGATAASGDTGHKPHPKPSEPAHQERHAQTRPSEAESRPARTEVKSPGEERSANSLGTGWGAQRTGGGQSRNDSGELPDSVRPEQFTRREGGGLWLPGGPDSAASGAGASGGGETAASGSGSGRQGSGQSPSGQSAAESAPLSGSRSGNIARPAPDTSRASREDSSRQSQRHTNEGRGSDRGRDNS